jgi:hypothetical protein
MMFVSICFFFWLPNVFFLVAIFLFLIGENMEKNIGIGIGRGKISSQKMSREISRDNI